MKNLKRTTLILIVVGLVLMTTSCKSPSHEGLNRTSFKNPSSENSIHAWWHWLDNSITKEGITKDLEAMKSQGISTVTILNVGLLGEKDMGVPQIKFNTPEWYEMFEWALHEANRLGMHVGAHNCDGWSSSGGPWITPEYSMKRCVWSKTVISGSGQTVIQLPQPKKNLNYYKDIRVVAFPSKDQTSSFVSLKPEISVNGKLTGNILYDSDPFSSVSVNDSSEINIVLSQKTTTTKIAIHPRMEFTWENLENIHYQIELKTSDDGKSFKLIRLLEGTPMNKTSVIEIHQVTARYYKLIFRKIAGLDFNPMQISELELLDKDEKPGYNTSIPFHLEKTVTTMAIKSGDILQQGKEAANSVAASSILDLTQFMTADGTLNWKIPEGTWTILRIGYTTTEATNAPATLAGRGLECDKMDTAALNLHFRSFPAKLIAHAGKYAGNTFEYMFIDSWECRYQNWTGSFVSEFEKRRHYSIVNWLPVICGVTVDNSVSTERFLQDFRQTIAELIQENYYRHFNELCHLNGVKSHTEVIYGGTVYPPLDILKSNSYEDVPMFEFWAGPDAKTGFINYRPVTGSSWEIPAQAAALYNKQIIPAESYTGYANYSETPWDLKLYGDRAFCTGINQIVLHSYVHQPFEKKPGVTLGVFGQSFNKHNPWWEFASQWFTYLARAQYLLQKGTPVADILYFEGDRYYNELKSSGEYEVPYGHSLQRCNLDVLLNHCKTANGKLLLDNGLSYDMLLLSDDSVMEYSTLKVIGELVNAGAVVAGPRPLKVAGNLNYDENEKQLDILSGQMWGNKGNEGGRGNVYGKGRVFTKTTLKEILSGLNVKPDFSCDRNDSINLLYIHKKSADADIYFVVNQENRAVDRECTFRIAERVPEIWDPEYGTVTLPADYRVSEGTTTVRLKFEPKEALFFIFEKKKEDGLQARKDPTEKYVLKDCTGTLEFEGLPDKKAIPVTGFSSWTLLEDPDIRYYTGKATYDLNFSVPSGLLSKNPVYISLDSVMVAYDITLNGKLLGSSVFPGYRFDVTGMLEEKDNKLGIHVANTWRNRIIGDFTQYGKLKNCWTTSPVNNLPGKDKPLQKSGIFGPVSLYY
jgi:hypothetical protein